MTDRELMQLAREKERADANEDDAKRWRNIKGYWRGVERELADAKERAERAEAELADLSERLALPEQEPVAWMFDAGKYRNCFARIKPLDIDDMVRNVTPLYTAPQPRQWQGLTDEELRQAYCEVSGKEWCLGGLSNAHTFYEAIEAKLKEKNT